MGNDADEEISGRKIFIPFMSWLEVKEALGRGKDMVIIPCGSNEQHGPHRPTGSSPWRVPFGSPRRWMTPSFLLR